jgi:four helix bundle protein
MKRHNFKALKVWQMSMNLVDDIYSLSRLFPKEELFGLTQQLRKSAISIPSNIAEGCGRGTDAQLVNFLNFAQGSSYELETQVLIAQRQFFNNNPDNFEAIIKRMAEVQKMIDGFSARFEQ